MSRGAPRRWWAAAAIVGLLAVAGVVAISASASESPSASGGGKPHLTERQILRVALTAAANGADPKPILIQHSQGTREKANLVDSGDVVPGRQWSYLIAERGHFVFKDEPGPPGARAPTGSVLTLVVNARTSQITDSGLSNRYPDLAKLGEVTTDLRRHHRGGVCPRQKPQPLPADAIAGASRAALAQARTIYAGLDRKGMRVTEAILADDDPARGGYAGRNCGHLVRSRSIVVYLQFPALLPSASLSEGVVLVSRFAGHYRVWTRLH
jgi:hypothetical protein